MRIFEIVKENVNLREAAELYGIDVNRYGKALCPFHNDRNPSLYVADDHYYCFACGEHGDVIAFVGKLFQLSPYDAARKLMADFISAGQAAQRSGAPRKTHPNRSTAAHGKRAAVLLCSVGLRPCAAGLKVRYAPQSPDAPVHARSWKPVTSSTKRNTIWIFCASGIPTNAPKSCSSRWQTANWTGYDGD